MAEGLVDAVVGSGTLDGRSARQVGLLDYHLRSAGWAIDAVLADLGDDPDPTLDHFLSLQQMKRVVTAAELAGGGAYARRGAVDRMIRDLRATLYHPYTPEVTLIHAGRARLGLELAV